MISYTLGLKLRRFGLFIFLLQFNQAQLHSQDISLFQVESFYNSNGLIAAQINALAQTNNGYLWIGTAKGLQRYNGLNFQSFFKELNPELPSDHVLSLVVDHKGILVISTLNGLAIWDNRKFNTYKHHEISDNTLKSIFESQDGTLWVGIGNGGIHPIPLNSTLISMIGGLPNEFIRSMVNVKNSLYLGSSKGLIRYENDSVHLYPKINQVITSFAVDTTSEIKQILWVGSDHGLFQLIDDSLQSTPQLQTISNQNITSLLVSKLGELWIGTSSGLYFYFRNKITKIHQVNEERITALFEDQHQNIWVGSNYGLHRVTKSINSINSSQNLKPQIHIDAILGDGLKYENGQFIVDHDFTSIKFQYDPIIFQKGDTLKYRYKIVGYDSNFIETNLCQATYPKVNRPFTAGDYQFIVEAGTSRSNWSGNLSTMNFKIKPKPDLLFISLHEVLLLVLVIFISVFTSIFIINKKVETGTKKEVAYHTKKMQHVIDTLAKKVNEQENINQIVKAINSETSITKLYNRILEESKIIKGVEKASVLLLDRETNLFKFKAAMEYELSELQKFEMSPDEANERYILHSVKLDEDIYIFENLPERLNRKVMTDTGGLFYEPIEFSKIFYDLPLPKVMIILRIVVEGNVEGYITLENTENLNAFERGDVGLMRNIKEPIVTAFSKTKLMSELKDQRDELQSTLKNLNETQAQLIHAEKMASLGELTAGIAHEIQNPLNFVNNFAEVSKEITDELNEDLKKINLTDEQLNQFKGILTSLSTNMEKIAHHGARASSIVKGMLEHSRSSSGEKRETDINASLLEALNLAYHGYRAKDKSFNAKLITELDSELPKIKVSTQDISRVFLNIITNGFYSAQEKSQNLKNDFQPEIKITTKSLLKNIEIRIRDNGKGISHQNIQKIFQPFFTTKPTGSGTGLGLSISYDIIKAHGGLLTAESKEGEFAEFIISIPY